MEKEELEKMTRDYQNVQAQLQSLALQKMQFTQQKEEYLDAEKALQIAKGKVYTELGGMIVETTKDDALKTLKDRMESMELHLNIANKQYDEANKKEQTLRATLTKEISKAQQ